MEIRAIEPGLVDDYFHLFDNAFTDNPFWAGCFCAYYDDPGSEDDWNPADPQASSQNRANREATIRDGKAHGLLAYEDDEAIGWVNAGPRELYGNLRAYAEAVEPGDDPIGAIMCFVIHPDWRGRGVASALLEEVDSYFSGLGLVIAEAYPRKTAPGNPKFPWTAAYYKGPPTMYEKAGYTRHREYEHFVSMRKNFP